MEMGAYVALLFEVGKATFILKLFTPFDAHQL